MGVLALSGRFLLASLFLLAGAMKLTHHSDGPGSPLVQFMTPKMDDALSRLHSLSGLQLRQVLPREHYPWLVFGAGCMELLGGILFTLNLKLGALLLMAFIVPTSFIMHNFWDLPQGSPAHQIEFVNFAKNVCLFGAFLMFAASPQRSSAAHAAPKLKPL